MLTSLKAQLNSFNEDWQPRSFNINLNNTETQNEINSSANVQISVNTSNVLANILPSHFGTNLTHFLGEAVINDIDFMKNLKNLGKNNFKIPWW
jgi:hypothetical protein